MPLSAKTRDYPLIWPIAKIIWSIAKKEVMPVRTGFEQLCLSHLPQLGLKPAKKGLEEKNGVGFTFVPAICGPTLSMLPAR